MPSHQDWETDGEIALSSARRAPDVRSLPGVLAFAARLWARSGPLLAAGLVLPNILSLATLGSAIDVGLPPRTACILLYAALAMCARRIPFAVTAVLFVAILGFDLVWTLSVSFGLRPRDLVVALDYAQHIHVLDSAFYVTLIAVLAVTSAATLRLLSNRETLLRGNIVALFAAALIFAGIDYISNADAHYNFGAMIQPDGPVESATNSSGFSSVAGVNDRNVVVVIVESLGYITDPTARAQVAAPLFDARVTQKYKITSGHVGYYGATTSGEMRELCDTREPYRDFTAKSGNSCLPERLHLRGYTTIAVHGFTGNIFERKEWYPKVGFDKELFGEDLVTRTKRMCGAAFRGMCDADLAPPIAKEAANTKKPRFVYWLTLNTHIPVPPGDALTNFNCQSKETVFGRPVVCRMGELWHDLFTAIARLAVDPAIGPAEILIVGDHAPPLWSKRGRAMFAPGQVAWYRLTPNDAVAAANF
jgi:Sulfatase